MKIETSIESVPVLILVGFVALAFFYFAGEAFGLYISNVLNN